MKARANSTRRFQLLVLAGLPLLLMAPQSRTPNPPAPARKVPVLRNVELVAPGTVIERSAPRGWSHLVLKSQPTLDDTQRRLVNDTYARLATMVFTTTLAHVEAYENGPERRYRLARLGVGVGVNIDGKDIVVSPDTQSRLGANLGFLAKQVLSGVYEKQKTVRLVAVGPTMAVLDTPAFMPRGRGHAATVMRYVFLVDGVSGKLDTLVWRIDTDDRGGYEGTTGFIEWLPANKMIDARMRVDLNEFRLGIPSEKAFAVSSIPSGQRQFSIPDGLRSTAGIAKLTSEQATSLASHLREMIRAASASASR